MMNFEEWLLKKQKMGWSWFVTMIPDKLAYYKEFQNYRKKAEQFHEEIQRKECEKAAKELVKLGN